MAGKGADALFRRVEEIANKLGKAGGADARDPGGFATIQVIDAEGSALLERLDGQLPSRHRPHTQRSMFGGHVAYVHNEFNFDVAYPLGGAALVTHISFNPIFPPQSVESGVEPPELHSVELRTVSASLADRLERLRKRAIHAPDDTFDENEKFTGGKDDIIHSTTRFFSYDQPVVTTMRAIERMEKFIRAKFVELGNPGVQAAAAKAAEWNDAHTEEMAGHGLSSRRSMLREFMLRKSGSSELRLTWVRHHSHYQTLTVIQHADVVRRPLPTGQNAGAPVFSEQDCAAVPTLCELADDITRLDPNGKASLVERTAFDAFPDGWADHLFGRYLQGANYLLLPLEWLFSDVHLRRVASAPGTNDQSWRKLCFQMLDLCGVPHARGQTENITVEQFRQLWAAGREDNAKLREVSGFAFALLLPLIDVLFSTKEDRHFEFVMCGAAEGAAIVLSDVRNFGRRKERALMSATLIIDLGMNDYERGRLLKHLTEFSTQRFVTLHSLGTFRFIYDALNVLTGDLSEATNQWEGTKKGKGKDKEDGSQDDPDGQFIAQLQDLTIDLTMLNSLVDRGIMAQTRSAESSRESVDVHIKGIGHYELPGFLSLTEYLDRRYGTVIRTISAIGRRYELLGKRIAELSALVEAKLEIDQAKHQTNLLNKVDRLTVFGMVYYAGQIVTFALLGIVAIVSLKKWDWFVSDKGPEQVKYLVYLVLIVIGLALGSEALSHIKRDLKKARIIRNAWLTILIGLLGAVALAFGEPYFLQAKHWVTHQWPLWFG